MKQFLRKSWGNDHTTLALRARRSFGSPNFFRWLKSVGLQIIKVEEKSINGEWVSMRKISSEIVILYIHGGGFVCCSAATHRPITTTLARILGGRVFSTNYRRAPESRFPAAIDDVTRSYKWLLSQGISPEKICIAGDSAGGGLTLSLLLRIRDEGMPPPACAVCFSPWADLSGSGDTVVSNAGKCAMFLPVNIAEFGSVYLGNSPSDNAYASPVFADYIGIPPVLFHVGSTELLLDDSRRIYEKINAAGGNSRLKVFDDVPHCWQMLSGIMPEANRSLRAAVGFMKLHAH